MNKVMIISGGSRGIGKSTITYFMKANWRVINLSRTPSNIPDVNNIEIDLLYPEKITYYTDHIHELLGEQAIISLVHNAGFLQNDSVQNININTLKATLAVNVISPMLLNNIIIPFMLPGSSIIYIGSTLSEKAVPNCASYSVSKHAVKGLMKATCQDLADLDIMTCCINPGMTDTLMLKEHMPDSIIEKVLQDKIIGKKLLEPNEIAQLIYFCAQSRLLNGSTIQANTGEREV